MKKLSLIAAVVAALCLPGFAQGGQSTFVHFGSAFPSGAVQWTIFSKVDGTGIFQCTNAPTCTSSGQWVAIGGTGGGPPLGTAGQIPVMNAGATAYAPVTISGDSTLSTLGAMTNTKINGVAFSGLATGILKNTTATGVPSIAVVGDVTGLFTGCSGVQYLGFDGACHSTGTGTVNSGTAGFPAVYPSSSQTVSAIKTCMDPSFQAGATAFDKVDAALLLFNCVDARNLTAANGFTMTGASGINFLRNCGGNTTSHLILSLDTWLTDVTVQQPKACIVEGAGRGLVTTIVKPAAALHTIAETNTKFALASGKLTWVTGSPGTVTATFPASTNFLFNANASAATTTVSGLGTATPANKSLVKTVTDGASATDCTVGSGATQVLCISTGIVWTFAPNVPDGMAMQVGCATATVGGRAPDAAYNGIWRAYSAAGSGTATPTVTYRAGNAAATLPASSTGVCTVIFLATPLWLQGDYFQANNYQGIRLEHLNLDADATCASLSGGNCTGASHFGIIPLVGINPQERSLVNDLSIINWNGLGIAGYGNDQNWGPIQNIESYMINSNANGNCNPTGANLDGNNGSGASSTVVRAGILPSEHVYLVDNAPKGIFFMTGTNGLGFSGANCQGSVGGGATVPTALVAGFDVSVPAATLLMGDHTELSDIGIELGKQYSGSANASFATTVIDFTGSPAADSDTTAVDISPLWPLNSDFALQTIRKNQGMTNTINNGITGHVFTDANIAKYDFDKNGSLVYECGSYTQFPCRVDGGLQSPTLLTEVANAAGGTTLNSLAKITSTGALTILVTDTQSPVWIVASGAGTSGNARFVMDGVGSCTMDATNGAGVEGQAVFASTVTAGDCTTAATAPIGAFILGRMISNTTTSGSTASVLVSAPHRALSDPFNVANAASTGTTLNALAKLTGAPSTLVLAATTDTTGIVGVVTSGAGTSGNATVQTIGLGKCIFDGATTADDYVQISSVTPGDCHDTGSTTRPTSGQIIGRVTSTNGGGGTYSLILEGTDQSASSGGGGSAFPVTVSGTVTSGGIPYFNSTTQESTSALLTQFGAMYGGGAGAPPTVVAPPTVNGTYFLNYPVTGSAALAPVATLAGVPVDATNPATLLYSDRASYLNWTSGTALALPAVATNFASNMPFVVKNTSTTLTITPNAGASDLIDGSATGTLIPNFAAFVYQDGTTAPGHWFTIKYPTFAAFPACADSAGNHINFTTAAGFSCGTSLSSLSAVNPQTATYQVLASDFTGYKTITVASGTFTITLVASGSQPAAGQYINVINYGSGVVTVARSGQNINGGTASITLNAGSATAPTSSYIESDGTNYFASIDEATTGTVTSFSAGTLSPLFTTSVGTATTTPALTFTLTNAGAFTVFGNATSSSAAPGYTTNPVTTSLGCGIAGTTSCIVTGSGSTSGSATVTWPAVAGTTTNPIAFSNAISTGTAPTVTTPGTGFYVFGTEGTEPASVGAGTSGHVMDSTSHCPIQWNNAANVGCAAALAAVQTWSAAQTFGTGDILLPAAVGTSAANGPLTIQAGIDAATTGASAIFVAKGEDVNGGSTASLAGGAATLRGGNNASTGNSNAGGAVNVLGGDATGGTGTTDTAGNGTVRGGNCTSTTGSCTPGTLTQTSGGFTAAFTNGAASDEIIAAGLGTGNAAVSHVKIQSPALSQTSGTTAQTQVTRFVTHVKAGSTTTATATNMFNVALANNQTAGFLITVHVESTQATPHNCSTTQTFLAAVQDTAATITSQTTAGPIATICDTGTLTLAAAFSAAAPSVFSVTPSWATIVPTAVTITIEVQNLSQQEIALL